MKQAEQGWCVSCKNCNEPIYGNYCSNCGQPVKPQRIDRHYIMREMASVLYAEKGMIYTLKRMFINPGESIRLYIKEDRKLHIKPITFIIITSLIYTLICRFFHINSEHFYSSVSSDGLEFPTVHLFLNWMINYQGYVNIIIGLFTAFWIKLFFRKSHYNLSEIFILMCYVSGVTVLLHSLVIFFQAATQLNLLTLLHISNLVVICYFVWVAIHFFETKKAIDCIKAFLSFGLGMLLFGFLIAFCAIFIDTVIKH